MPTEDDPYIASLKAEIEALRDKIIEQGRHAASLQHHLISAQKQLIEIAQFLGRDASAEGVSSIADVVRQDVEELRSKINHSGVVKRKINREVLKELHEMRGNPDECYIPPVTLAKRAVKAEAEIERLRLQVADLQAILPTTADGVAVTPGMDLWSVDGGGCYQWLVEVIKSNGVVSGSFHDQTEGPHDAESCYSTREAAEACKRSESQ